MFYRQKKYRWPEGFTRSSGPCEVCGQAADRFDIPRNSCPEKANENPPPEVLPWRQVQDPQESDNHQHL